MAQTALCAWPLSLDGIDALVGADLVAFVGEAERPLQGLAGLLDWRLCGALTRQLRAGAWSGGRGERVLTVTLGRLQSPRLFLFGLGPQQGVQPRDLSEAVEVLQRAGARQLAMAAPEPLSGAIVEAAAHADVDRICWLVEDVTQAERRLEDAAAGVKGVRVERNPAGRPSAAQRTAPAVVR